MARLDSTNTMVMQKIREHNNEDSEAPAVSLQGRFVCSLDSLPRKNQDLKFQKTVLHYRL